MNSLLVHYLGPTDPVNRPCLGISSERRVKAGEPSVEELTSQTEDPGVLEAEDRVEREAILAEGCVQRQRLEGSPHRNWSW